MARPDYFGAWLHTRRLELRKTLRACAAAGGVSCSVLCELETGKKIPWNLQIRVLPKLAKAYQIKIEVLLRRLHILE